MNSDKAFWQGAVQREPHPLDKQFILREHAKRKAERHHGAAHALSRVLVPRLRMWIAQALLFAAAVVCAVSACSQVTDASAPAAVGKLDTGVVCETYGTATLDGMQLAQDCVYIQHGQVIHQTWTPMSNYWGV